MNIIGIAGSLRKDSYNRAALRAAKQLSPNGLSIRIYEIDEIPLYNQDNENPPPEPVRDFKASIKAADGVLFVTPEYNYSVPGVLKNAIDWASRPYGDNSFDGKPVGIMGASIGSLGSARAQYHLRQMFVFLNMIPLNRPEVMISNAADKFDGKLNLTDEPTKKVIREFLQALYSWVVRQKEMKVLH